MASLKYCDKHNQVGFLKKPKESAGFAEIVDFLKGSHIRYALTHNPTIHDFLVKQFWQTATGLTLADGTLELRATIDTLEYTITEASVRNKLQLETEVPQSQDTSHPHVPEARTMTLEYLLHLVPNLITKVDSLETELKQTKLTIGKAIVKLVKKDIDDDPLGSKRDFVTPTKPSGKAQEKEISPTILEAAKILSKVASQKSKSVDKGKRYKMRKEPKGKAISTSFEKVNTGFKKVNTGGLGVSSARPVSLPFREAIRLRTLEEEETAKQVHLDALLAKRLAKKEEAKLEANAELTKDVLGKDLFEQDFAKEW
ncbi:hypothetical protein Tco_1480529 [Tanacetum coccineum]